MDKLKLFNTVVLYKQITIWDKGQKEDLIILQSKKMQGGRALARKQIAIR